jgi:D-arabinose 1-dehydrogenase-like Zn-dependent alcohol dehydrogenase
MHELMALARSGKVPGLPIATRPLADAGEVLASLGQGRIVGRVVLTP